MEKKRPFIILTGPTAVGKTKLSVLLAKAVGGEIISADSMQVYEYMDIGSAKIKREEMQGVPHFMIDILKPWEPFNVTVFQNLAKQYMEEIYERGHIPILVGGTGFYIQSVLYDIDFMENTEDGLRRTLEALSKEKGASYMHGLLQKVDPKAAEKIHKNNVKRVIRALEFYQQTGRKISQHNEEERSRQAAYNACYFVLNENRDTLYARIDERVEQMVKDGLLEEVRQLRDMGCTKDMVSMQGLGYKEMFDCLEKTVSMEEAVRIIKRDTRHFAKRQLTWFQRERDVIWVEKETFSGNQDAILAFLLKQIKEKGIL